MVSYITVHCLLEVPVRIRYIWSKGPIIISLGYVYAFYHLPVINHNGYQQKHDEVNETILEWFEQAREGTLQGGIWKTGVKTKL